MNNKEWLTTLNNKKLADILRDPCEMCIYDDSKQCTDANCISGILMWLNREHVEPKKEFTASQLVTGFEVLFSDRRAISLDEIKKYINGLFD